MKSYIALALISLGIGSASATTVVAGGGLGGAQFYTSTGLILTNTNSTIQVGNWNGIDFTQFAVADSSPIVISTVATLAGRWSASAADTSVAANAFNNTQIWFKITTSAGGGGTAYFSSGALFPANGGGVGDSTTVSSLDLSILGAGSSEGSRAYSSGDGRVLIGVVPEPSVALLGALGVFGLVRRRR